jgi:hypothetical protein
MGTKETPETEVRIADQRRALGFSLDEASLATGIPRSVLQRFEARRGSLCEEDRVRLARLLRIDRAMARRVVEFREEVPA